MRTARFGNAARELRQLEPNNRQLSYVAPPGWVPSEANVGDIEFELGAARGRATGRPNSDLRPLLPEGNPPAGGVASPPRQAVPASPAIAGPGANAVLGGQPRPAQDSPGQEQRPLLNAERAVIDMKKVEEYALNPDHPVGGNKAKVFESALGFNRSNMRDLLDQIRAGVRTAVARPGAVDQYGARFTVDIDVVGPKGSGAVRTGWILTPGSDVPRLTTMFVK